MLGHFVERQCDSGSWIYSLAFWVREEGKPGDEGDLKESGLRKRMLDVGRSA